MFGKKFIWEAEYMTLNFGLKGFDQSNGNMSWWVFAPFGEVFQVRNELREKMVSKWERRESTEMWRLTEFKNVFFLSY